MECPRLHGNMTAIELSSDIEESSPAFYCETCHAVFLSEADCCDHVDIDVKAIPKAELQEPVVDLVCPNCGGLFRAIEREGCRLYVCTECCAAFLDAGIMATLMNRILKKERDSGSAIEAAPFERMTFKCDDCGATIDSIEDMTVSPIGCSCKKCAATPPILSESKQLEVQIVTFHGMEVKIDRAMTSRITRISVTPAEPGKLDVYIHSLSWVERLYQLGWRRLDLHGTLRKKLDASEDIACRTPWQMFLKQRGIIECFERMQEMGNIKVTLKPHSLIFELEGDRIGAETRMKLEATVRRFLIAYERYTAAVNALYAKDNRGALQEEPPKA